MSDVTYGDIWEKLYPINCTEFAKSKNNLTYLAWNSAWRLLMMEYPDAHFEFEPMEDHPDGSQTVHCVVVIGGLTRRMWLPVMDYKNKAIANPNARDVSDTKMRCLVKCIAMFGLGFHIFQGQVQPEDTWNDDSDQPAEEPVKEPEAKKKTKAKPKAEESKDMFVEDTNVLKDELAHAATIDQAKEVINKYFPSIKQGYADHEGFQGLLDHIQERLDQIKNIIPQTEGEPF